MSKLIKLTQNKITIVDDKYYNLLNQYKWCAVFQENKFYSQRRRLINENWPAEKIKMHRYILFLEGYDINNKQIDHKNGDSLDNRIKNLRICNQAENSRNRIIQKNNTSGYKGVDWYKNYKKWRTRIKVNNKLLHIGYFIDKKDAAKAYNIAAIKYYGEFANINIL